MNAEEEEERKRGMKEEAEAVDASMGKVKHKVMVMSGKG
ncbi:MAG: ATP-binding protein, partial [Methanophagales archaeon]|nr:ATP-binding protein [Methanophagales archaeon]